MTRGQMIMTAAFSLALAAAAQAQQPAPEQPVDEDDLIPAWSDVRRVDSPMCLEWTNFYDRCWRRADHSVECSIDTQRKRYVLKSDGTKEWNNYPVMCKRFWLANVPKNCGMVFNGREIGWITKEGYFSNRARISYSAPSNEGHRLVVQSQPKIYNNSQEGLNNFDPYRNHGFRFPVPFCTFKNPSNKQLRR